MEEIINLEDSFVRIVGKKWYFQAVISHFLLL